MVSLWLAALAAALLFTTAAVALVPAAVGLAATRTWTQATGPRLGRAGGAVALRCAKDAGTREQAAPARLVFLGTPGCVCSVLERIHAACAAPGSGFQLSAVVTRPPQTVRRGKQSDIVKSDVHQLAESLGVERIWTPETAKDEGFLDDLEALAPDICITAAYGQYLPKRFLATPRLGTLNLHPSTLPRWRGASPVQRALQAGDLEMGMTILYTVSKMDAGPIAWQRTHPLTGNETSPEMLDFMFKWGAQTLVREVLPGVLAGDVTFDSARAQDEDQVTKASMIRKEEGKLWPHNETARVMLNKIRAFEGWPSTTLPLACAKKKDAPPEGYRAIVFGLDVAPAAEVLNPEDMERPIEELVFIPAQGDRPPTVAVRPAADPEEVLLLRTVQLPTLPKEQAEVFAKKYMTAQAARWMRPDEENEMVAAGPKKKKKRMRGRS